MMVGMNFLAPHNLDEPLRAALPFPAIDKVAFTIFGFEIYWYALAYLFGVLIGWMLLKRLTMRPGDIVGAAPLDALINMGIIGIILGGRLVYVVFYNPEYYLANPADIIMVRDGGMSFHGGFLGMVAAIIWVARRHRVPMLALGDCVALAAPIGIFLGRLANFINGELFGRITDVPWAIVFPKGGPLPRHPSQIYEALLEGVVLFVVLALIWQRGGRRFQGLITGTFISGYGVSRIIVEFAREPDQQLGFLIAGTTMGQWLSLPMVMIGALFIRHALRHPGEGTTDQT